MLWFVQLEEGQDDSQRTRSRCMARQTFFYLINFFGRIFGRLSVVLSRHSTEQFHMLSFLALARIWKCSYLSPSSLSSQ
ncbi:hypothetical protein ACHAWF_014818 [Thalassiosira exigua]